MNTEFEQTITHAVIWLLILLAASKIAQQGTYIMSKRIRPHMYYVITTNLRTKKFYLVGFNDNPPEPVSREVAEVRLAAMPAEADWEHSIISVEEFNRKFDRKG